MIGNSLSHDPVPIYQAYPGGPLRCKVCGMLQVEERAPVMSGSRAVIGHKWPHFVCPGYREFKTQSVDLGGPYPNHEYVTLRLWPDGRVTWTE